MHHTVPSDTHYTHRWGDITNMATTQRALTCHKGMKTVFGIKSVKSNYLGIFIMNILDFKSDWRKCIYSTTQQWPHKIGFEYYSCVCKYFRIRIKIFIKPIWIYMLSCILSKMLSSSRYALLKLSKTTSSQRLFPYLNASHCNHGLGDLDNMATTQTHSLHPYTGYWRSQLRDNTDPHLSSQIRLKSGSSSIIRYLYALLVRCLVTYNPPDVSGNKGTFCALNQHKVAKNLHGL